MKRVFAPTPRSERAQIVDLSGKSSEEMGETLMAEIFTRSPGLESALEKMAAGY